MNTGINWLEYRFHDGGLVWVIKWEGTNFGY